MFVHQTFSLTNAEGSGRGNAIAAEAVRAGYRVSIVAGANSYLTGDIPKDSGPVEECDGYRVYRPATYGNMHASFLHRALYFLFYMCSSFWVLLRMPRPDVVVGCSPPITVAAAAFAVARLRRVPFVFEVRDLWPSFPIEMGVLRNSVIIRLSFWLERTLYRNARYVVINSPGFLPHLRARGVPSSRIREVPNGVDVDQFKPLEPDPSIRTGLGLESKFLVLYIGAHGQANALDRLIEVAALMKDDPSTHFLLIGAGKEKKNLVERARREGLQNITFLPPQPKQDMPRYIAAADLCFCSLQNIPMFTTTYPNKVFDYMACGKALLTTIDGVSRSVIEQSRCGFYVPHTDVKAIAEAIAWASTHMDELRLMGERGRSAAVADWDRRFFARAFVRVLDDVRDVRA